MDTFTVTKNASSVPDIDLNELRQAIQEEYKIVAENPADGFHFHTGRPLTRILGYDEAWLADVPESSIDSFAGTGNPFSLGTLKPGDRVVDVGSGAGLDSLIGAKMVGPEGQVIGVEMTPAMLTKARLAAKEAELDNVEFREGFAEALPVLDGWADVAISNGVLNLMPDKSVALVEMARVLKPGGRLQIADILVEKPVPDSAKSDIDLWTGYIAGALLDAELEMAILMAGFVAFEITWRADVFRGAPQEGSAVKFGTKGINFRARKAKNDGEWWLAMAGLNCEMAT
jgi:SAM-dependent methyltransferase